MQIIIKNYTDQDLIISDLGDLLIPKNGALEIGGDESRLIELASSDGLLAALSQGIEKYQVNNGTKDCSLSEGIDLVRKVSNPIPQPKLDALERWVVRTESKREEWDTVFQGAGDNTTDLIPGDGTSFLFDFSAPVDDPRWSTEAPEGYACQSIKWAFCTPVYVKEGTMYYFNTPTGTYADFYVASPPGYPYVAKMYNENFDIVKDLRTATEYTRFQHWVIHYHIEGNAPIGDELNTESAAEYPSYPFHIYEARFTIPMVEGWQNCHGHWSLEIFRPGTIHFTP